MVAITRAGKTTGTAIARGDPLRCSIRFAVVFLLLVVVIWIHLLLWAASSSFTLTEYSSDMVSTDNEKVITNNKNNNIRGDDINKINPSCPVVSISTLSQDDRDPIAGKRHMVTPPKGGNLSLLCCTTTKGNISLLLHNQWAPIGTARFLEMVHRRYFHSRVALFRCTDACQFGLAGSPNITALFDETLPDDPPWMPPGPEHRQNAAGIRRYPKGFLTYAGSGPHSRSNQFVLTLKPNLYMGGGSPWEVPIGEVVGESSFEVLDRLETEYGEKGPSQRLLRREGGMSKVIREKWPKMDYITSCTLIDVLERD